MRNDWKNFRILTVSDSDRIDRLLAEILPQNAFSPPTTVHSVGQAKRLLVQSVFDIILINTPLQDEFGTQIAWELCEKNDVGILLFTKSDCFEEVLSMTEGSGIFVLSKPCSKSVVYQTIVLLMSMQNKLLSMKKKTASLQAKMDEIRTVNHAKWLLIDRLKMNEQAAHRFIEKQAMDTCQTKQEIAENIIRTYEI